MSPRLLPFSQVIEQERRRWVPFRGALSMEDQEAFDRMCACATQPLQAEVEMGRPWRFEAHGQGARPYEVTALHFE
jgi:hypothetical protein